MTTPAKEFGGVPSAYDGRRIIYTGVIALVKEVKKYALSFPQKTAQMQASYLSRNTSLFSIEEKQQIEYSLAVANFKFHLFTLDLEALWTVSENTRIKLFETVDNSLNKLVITDDEMIASSLLLENFLFHGVAFLDIYMLYLLQFLKTKYTGSLTSQKRFFRLLADTPEPFKNKASQIENYFRDQVFNPIVSSDGLFPNNWGVLLRSLRDKVAHRDRIRPRFEGNEVLMGGVLFDWPTVQGLTWERFAQAIQSGAFAMVHELSKILYELDWYTGPYDPNRIL